MADPTWKYAVFNNAASTFKPCRQTVTGIIRDLTLNRPASLSLGDCGTLPKVQPAD
jgi:hypothetical protein